MINTYSYTNMTTESIMNTNVSVNSTATTQSQTILTPNPPLQYYKQIEWVYPNDGESEYYTYEQMMNDWVPSDPEYYSSSEDECENYFDNDYYDEW